LKPKIIKANTQNPILTPERCYIAENYSNPEVSIAYATVRPGITTMPHHLLGVQEIYIITQGQGKVTVGDLEPKDVNAGDVVVIPPGNSQKRANTGKTDLVFYCICTPRFTEKCYVSEKEDFAQSPAV
jgi:mannose-6-phosphate isomerase-like protein (cupin superfamily)